MPVRDHRKALRFRVVYERIEQETFAVAQHSELRPAEQKVDPRGLKEPTSIGDERD